MATDNSCTAESNSSVELPSLGENCKDTADSDTFDLVASSAGAPSTPLRARTISNDLRVNDEALFPESRSLTPVSVPDADNEDDSDIKDNDTEELTRPKWSEILRSPDSGWQFSPSREINSRGNLHGLSLMLAVDRATKLSRCGQRCANLLFDIEGIYDTYANAVQKSCQVLSSASAFSSTPLLPQIGAANKSLVSFSKQIQGLAICIRGSIARPLHGSMGSMGETAPSIYKRYTKTRFNCYNKRKNALQMRAKYVRAVREAENAIQSLQSRDGEISQRENANFTDTAPNDAVEQTQSQKAREKTFKKFGMKLGESSGSTDKMIRLLNAVQSYEAQYRQLVEEENKAIAQSQRVEVMALESIQDLEEERLHFFLEMMGRILEAEKGAFEKMALSSLEADDSEESEEQKEAVIAEGKEKKVNVNVFTDLFMLPSSGPNEDERVGLMEAETLGLPEEVGLLRDDVRSHLSRRMKRLQAVRALSTFFEDIAVATSTLTNGLKTRLAQDGYSTNNAQSPNTLAVALAKYEGQRVLGFWDSIVSDIDEGSISAKQLSETIRGLRHQKLDPVVLQYDKEIKTATEADDSRWKYLCETARGETKAENRYRQTAVQFEKARSRLDSKGDQGAPTNSQSKSLKPGMSKALGNMMSILPNGGEHAMKIMTPSAQMAIANSTYEEANKKELKDKQALDVATEAKTRAMEKYTKIAQELIHEHQKDEIEGWNHLRLTLKLLVSALGVYRENRSQRINQPSKVLQETGDSSKLKDILEWTERVQSHNFKKEAACREQISIPTASPGKFVRRNRETNEEQQSFKLDVQLEDSESVYKVLSFIGENEGDTASEDLNVEEPSSSIAEQPTSGKSISEHQRSHSTGEVEAKSDDDDKPPVSITYRRSLTTPSSPTTRNLKSLAETLRDHAGGDGNQKVMMPLVSPKVDSTKETPSKPETEVFLMHFWSDGDEGEPPTIIESFSCAYWPTGSEATLSPLLHGRMFVTSKTMYFIGWGGKKIVLDWKDVINVTKEKNMMGTIDNSLCIAYNNDKEESSYYFGSFVSREEAFQLSTRLTAVATALVEMEEGGKKAKASSATDVPPDQTIKTKMETLLSKTIKNVSIQQFYEIVWSEGNKTTQQPFYGPWLEEQGSEKVNISDWEFSEDGTNTFENEWSGEKFQQKRQVDFEFERTTHLYIGPPVAGVHQTQYCTVEGNDKCVVAMTVEMSGIPYADCFAVEVRWVARRIGCNDIGIDVGVFVNFKKSTMFAAKIRSGTTTETKPVHLRLFESARKACAAAAGEEVAMEEEEGEKIEEVNDVIEKKPHEIIITYIMEQLKTMLQSPQENAVQLVVLGVLVLFVMFRFIRFILGLGRNVQQAETLTPMLDTENLEQKVEDLTVEVQKIRLVMEQMMILMKENANTVGGASSSCDNL